MRRKIDRDGEPEFSGAVAAFVIGLAVFIILSVVSYAIARIIIEEVLKWL